MSEAFESPIEAPKNGTNGHNGHHPELVQGINFGVDDTIDLIPPAGADDTIDVAAAGLESQQEYGPPRINLTDAIRAFTKRRENRTTPPGVASKNKKAWDEIGIEEWRAEVSEFLNRVFAEFETPEYYAWSAEQRARLVHGEQQRLNTEYGARMQEAREMSDKVDDKPIFQGLMTLEGNIHVALDIPKPNKPTDVGSFILYPEKPLREGQLHFRPVQIYKRSNRAGDEVLSEKIIVNLETWHHESFGKHTNETCRTQTYNARAIFDASQDTIEIRFDVPGWNTSAHTFVHRAVKFNAKEHPEVLSYFKGCLTPLQEGGKSAYEEAVEMLFKIKMDPEYKNLMSRFSKLLSELLNKGKNTDTSSINVDVIEYLFALREEVREVHDQLDETIARIETQQVVRPAPLNPEYKQALGQNRKDLEEAQTKSPSEVILADNSVSTIKIVWRNLLELIADIKKRIAEKKTPTNKEALNSIQ